MAGLGMAPLRNGLESHRPLSEGDVRLIERLDELIDELLGEDDLASSSLASILTAARDSVRGGYHMALARRIWSAGNELGLRGAVRLEHGGRQWRVH
jgi:hypothetical protein